MQKYLPFAITAAVLLTAVMTVTLYTASAAHAVYNPIRVTKAHAMPSNMTNATVGAAKNMTNSTVGTLL